MNIIVKPNKKVATFYNPTIENYYGGVKNELADLKNTDDLLAEVAISFDRPYRYSEVKKKCFRKMSMLSGCICFLKRETKAKDVRVCQRMVFS